MADYDYNTRRKITELRDSKLDARTGKLKGDEKKLAEEIKSLSRGYRNGNNPMVDSAVSEYYAAGDKKPSQWFEKKGLILQKRVHGGILDAFVPKDYQDSYLYIIDKLNRFPYSTGYSRRTVRTRGYGPQMRRAIGLLNTYERIFYCGGDISRLMLRQLEPEMLDYIKSESCFMNGFDLVYAAEIDRGNQKVIDTLKELILSDNNTAYLDRQMILGILRSDNEGLHKLLADLLVAAKLQEGLRQAICESMDEGTIPAFLLLLKVIEDNDLIRFASVKRAVSTWIGIFDENSADRISGKLLGLMGSCLRDSRFCDGQLKSNDSIAISVALWAKGFWEIYDAMDTMKALIDHGTKPQKLAASYYNQSLQDDNYKSMVAKKVLLEQGEDLELAACFMPAFTCRFHSDLSRMFTDRTFYGRELLTPRKPVPDDIYGSREEAGALYAVFLDIYKRMPKKGLVYDPCIFPWYKVELSPGMVLGQLALLAYILQDEEKITYMAGLLGEITSQGGYSCRSQLINLLLYEPGNRKQREILLGYVGNAEEYTAQRAYAIVMKLKLEEADYMILEDMLRYKRSGLRGRLIDLLMEQDDAWLKASVTRLLSDKREEKRTAALDMMMRLSRMKDKDKLYQEVRELPLAIKAPTDKEKILIEELTGSAGTKADISRENGYGLYDPAASAALPMGTPDPQVLEQCLPLKEKDVILILKKLDSLVGQYRDYEYLDRSGEAQLLGNGYHFLKDAKDYSYHLENYPLAKEFREFYENEIKSHEVLMEMEALLFIQGHAYDAGDVFYRAVWGKSPFKPEPLSLVYMDQVRSIRLNYRTDYLDRASLFKESLAVIQALSAVVNQKNKKVTYQYRGWNNSMYDTSCYMNRLPLLDRYFEGLKYWQTDQEFRLAFETAYGFELKCRDTSDTGQFLTDRREPMTPIGMSWFMKAYLMSMISMDILIKAVFEYLDTTRNLQVLTQFVHGECAMTRNRWNTIQFFGEAYYNQIQEKGNAYMLEHTQEGRLCKEIYDKIVPQMVDVELRRGDSETCYSRFMGGITYICGARYLVRILMALGKDTLDRNSYYGWYGGSRIYTKKEVLSGLLKSCYPAEDDTPETLGQLLKETEIKESRLVEVAMYAPQWIDIIEGYLGWKGLKSGCYYFMAHMDENFDDRKKAIFAKYTPLSPEELQNGAFDVNWFREAYGQLGEEHFSLLYDAAKYISDGQKHSRARKYADAAAGRVGVEELKNEIGARRNKDLLMSLGLVPFGEDGNRDMVDRYQYIQQFLKESRQFGAQRRASETKAAETALTNLSVNAGFEDVTRLTLNMETRLMEQFREYMEWRQVDDVLVKLEIREDGKSEILCRKAAAPGTDTGKSAVTGPGPGKALKSIPSRLGKDAYVMELKAVHKKLKDQYSRTRKMMEESMENQTLFTVDEVSMLYANPVVRAILAPLVFVSGGKLGFMEMQEHAAQGQPGNISPCLVPYDGTRTPLKGTDLLRIAHPLDLYRQGVWHGYQKYLFDNCVRQPFKQVFRELYVKLPEEQGQKYSRMFAGNQIQPQKTVAVLRGRRWIADYEEGLQKVYYKEDIIARIYALADWFSPSDVEAPTLEWVEFSDRKTFESLEIDKVPDLIYSEVMRDVDLAVSVAHAGGVDPETSHSTIEMRRAIVEFNLPLFGISNVTLKDSHAMIKGARGEYTVHLGSGVIHQAGGAMLNILPVHSQSRGRLFLPFVDEDPKTAEIMSKIVLLAEDRKIKDPSILEQIV
ncbi:DUF4132 domain-containing protein [Clostridiales bacterium TF09-2AC]|nr:DUF4132 domain-containing protein [Clostridiales bacterium TF09-2AC]